MVPASLTSLLNGMATKCRYACSIAAYEASNHYAVHVVLTGWRQIDSAYQSVCVANMIDAWQLKAHGSDHVVRAIVAGLTRRLEHELDCLPIRMGLAEQTKLLEQML